MPWSLLVKTLFHWWVLLSLVLVSGGMAFMPITLRGQGLQPLRQHIMMPYRRVMHLALAGSVIGTLLAAYYHLVTTVAPLLGAYSALILVRLALLGGLAVLVQWAEPDVSVWVLVPGAALLFTQSLLSHSAQLPQPLAPVLADWIHLTFASLWLGGVAMLSFVVTPHAEPKDLGMVISHFSPLAMFCVFAVTLTGIIQSASFVGSLSELFTATYGRTILMKVALLIVLIGFGAFHQQVISPQLQAWALRDRAGVELAVRRFRISILLETVMGVLILLAAGTLTALPPSISTPLG